MVKRYYIEPVGTAHEHPEGYLVSHEDYAALEGENGMIKARADGCSKVIEELEFENKMLKADVLRLEAELRELKEQAK